MDIDTRMGGKMACRGHSSQEPGGKFGGASQNAANKGRTCRYLLHGPLSERENDGPLSVF